ncbi:glycerophosphodiester phosphodiesterase family protein [Microbacterium sp. STF-2]|uniref:glycerophosphodiester phosphodiesterase family protein n=1 Tax=Microbacterium sp. STF-2 TaxID=3031132 RepID=UPI002AFFFA42|nr:glycerophosphodiester phosphodiesterase family protein [Microbacterium sp. STF-2]MEA1262867.1 glycerophosphodiester phosphodiesterase family protein [Microbacterium sp. STF-2]
MFSKQHPFWTRVAGITTLGLVLGVAPMIAADRPPKVGAGTGTETGTETGTDSETGYGQEAPLIVAHRAGTADYPENTREGIRGSLEDGADALWITVQLSRDGVPVLYRPIGLDEKTNGTGTVAEKTVAELTALNAGWNFRPRGSEETPYRDAPALLPTLRQALADIPADRLLFLDLKQADPVPLADAVVAVLRDAERTENTVIYSTDAAASGRARDAGDVQVAEDRDVTRKRLLDIALAHECEPPPAAGTWMAFEDRRKITVSETFTSGTTKSEVEVTPWDREAVRCIDPTDRVNLMAIGVADAERYRDLARVGVDAVLVDSPRDAVSWKYGHSR